MATKLLPLTLLLLFFSLNAANAQLDIFSSTTHTQLHNETMDWTFQPHHFSLQDEDEQDARGIQENEDDEEAAAAAANLHRRSLLYWRSPRRYYISYGALSANRVPCPPRSGRSYYTHNCYAARGPVHPYSRGCSAITRCRR